jgi:hypothetical protein
MVIGTTGFSDAQKKTIVENDSQWAVNPKSFKWGYICFNNDNKPTERLVPVSQPKPNVAELPDTGFEWQEEWAVNMKCTTGTDKGTEVIYKASTVGGIQAIAGMIDTIRDRLNGGMDDGKIVPIVLLEKDSYPHSQFGRHGRPRSRSSTGCHSTVRRRRQRRRRHQRRRRRRRPSSHAAGGSPNANMHLKAGLAAAAPPRSTNR